MICNAIRWIGPAALFSLAFAALAANDAPPPTQASPPASGDPRTYATDCRNCAVITRIRTIERERPPDHNISAYISSEQYQSTRQFSEPRVGPMFGMTFGPGQETKTFVGAAGSETMRQRLLELAYEITVRYDDGRYGLIELNDASAFRRGDHVRVVDNQLELLPRQPPK